MHKNVTSPLDVLRTYGKVAVKAHQKTNCLTEILFPEAEQWLESEINLKGPLAGIPISLKDTVGVGGFDVSVGYSCNTGKPYIEDGAMVKLLKDAGQTPTQLCIARLALMCTRGNSIRKDEHPGNAPLLRIYQ